MLTRKLVAALAFAAAAVLMAPVSRALAQDVVQDEGTAYRAWYEATQAKDNAKAMEAAKQYLAQYPTGQYAESLKKWMGATQMALLDAAIKEKRTADMIAIGQQVLGAEPDNLNVLYAIAFNIRRNEMLASPPNFQNAPAAVEFANKAIALIEGGKTLTGVQNFDKNATLAWLTQILALNAQKSGSPADAKKLFEQSTALAPTDPQVAGRNLLSLLGIEQADYAEAAKAFNAIPEADRGATDKPEVKAAREKLDAEADGLIDVAARFVALANVKGLPAATRDRVKAALESVYKVRFPEDTALAGLQKIVQEKEAALGGTPAAAPAPAPGA